MDAPNQAPEQGQAAGQGWYEVEGITDETKGYVQNKGWDNPIKAITAYQNLEKHVGVPADQLLRLPKDPSENGAMDPVYERLGRPKTPQEYGKFTAEGYEVDENRISHFDQAFHKLGLNTAQRNELIKGAMEYENTAIKAMLEQQVAKSNEEMKSLENEWGPAAAERKELARRAVRTFIPGDQKDQMLNSIENAIGTASMMKLFANIGEKLGEHKIVDGDNEQRPFGKTPEQVKADIASLKGELQGGTPEAKARLAKYNEGKGPDYEAMSRLQKQLYG